MARVWNEFLEPHPYEFDMHRVSAKEYEMRVLLESPIPPGLSLLFGEWLYNLRSALDYVVWAAAVHTSRKFPPPGESALQYPIYDDASAWKRNLYRLAPLAEHHREMLLTMQPFNSDPDGNYLGWLNRLARIDRHRTLANLDSDGVSGPSETVCAALDASHSNVTLSPKSCTSIRASASIRKLTNGPSRRFGAGSAFPKDFA